jgi:hypothetical protein
MLNSDFTVGACKKTYAVTETIAKIMYLRIWHLNSHKIIWSENHILSFWITYAMPEFLVPTPSFTFTCWVRILEKEQNSSLITQYAECEMHKKYKTFCGMGYAKEMGMAAWLINDELDRMWKKASTSGYYPGICLEKLTNGINKIKIIRITAEIRSKYKSEVLLTEPTCSVSSVFYC